MPAMRRELREILDDRVVRASMDRSKPVDDLVDAVLNKWSLNIVTGEPAPVYTNMPNMHYREKPTDLLTLVVAHAQSGVAIISPDYRALRPVVKRKGEHILSRNRLGKILGINSNQDTHAFSVKIQDYALAQHRETAENIWEKDGGPRSFMLATDAGRISSVYLVRFLPETDALINRNGIDRYRLVHPSLANAPYWTDYLGAKALMQRVEDEAAHYRSVAREARRRGARLQKKGTAEIVSKERAESISVETLHAMLKLPEFRGTYPVMGINTDGKVVYEEDRMPRSSDGRYLTAVLRHAKKRANELAHDIGPRIDVTGRSVELAFHDYIDITGSEPRPPWYVPKWEDANYSPRTKGRALEIVPGKVKLLYRIHPVSATVRAA